MGNVIYSMSVSLDGFIAGPGGEIDWSAPDEELHRFHNRQTAELGGHLCGRRLYEEMLYWETADRNPSAPEHVLEFARIWQALPKVVFSTTLQTVEGNARLARDGIADEVARLKEQPGGDVAVGGAGLAASLMHRRGGERELAVRDAAAVLSACGRAWTNDRFPSRADSVRPHVSETQVRPRRRSSRGGQRTLAGNVPGPHLRLAHRRGRRGRSAPRAVILHGFARRNVRDISR